MPADEPLCTVQNVADAWPAFARLSATEQQSLCDVASQKILNFVRRGFIQTFENETHSGRNNPVIWLKRRPVITIAQITVNGDVLDNTLGAAWTISPNSGKLTRGTTDGILYFGDPRFQRWWPVGVDNILVQYWAGYVAVPDPIIRAAIFYVRYLREKTKVSGVFSAESIGDYSYTLNAVATKWGLPEQVLDLCLDYVQDDGPL